MNDHELKEPRDAAGEEQGLLKNKLSFHNRRLVLALIDILCYMGVFLFVMVGTSFFGRFNLGFWLSFWPGGLVVLALLMTLRLILRVYNNVWRYPNVRAYLMMVLSDGCGGVFGLFVNFALRAEKGFFFGVWETVLVVVGFNLSTMVLRFLYQLFCQINNSAPKDKRGKRIRVAIVGAGQIGCLLADELNYGKKSQYLPVCFFERDKSKVGGRVCGLKVYDEMAIEEKVHTLHIEEVFIAIPGLGPKELKALSTRYAATGCKVKLQTAPVTPGMIRRLTEDDYVALMGRGHLLVNNDETRAFYRGQTVLVTGGGGSIGSEICRQIAKCGPKRLIILDIYENNAYDIQQELKRIYGGELDLCVEIASVRDPERLECVFANYRPDVVFHAAAHKHVPLMEHSNCEAIKNNILGTYNTANMAEKYGVKKFVLISTDKAVNPTNIMGASKRMCEMVVQCRTDSKTTFAAVRFGNVLGSNGSVIPLFQDQISQGGPVTVTDKHIVRYFMTIPEASQLVMQAGAMAKSGELFVLDMGKEVTIWSLAENLIYMTGYIPGVDIEIRETGLRPGEKLYEELLVKSDNITLGKTANDLIYVEKCVPPTRDEVEKKLALLRRAVSDARDELESPIIREAFKRTVPTFREPEEVNRTAEKMKEVTGAVSVTRFTGGA